MAKTRTRGAARAGRRAATQVGAGEGTGNLRPLQEYARGLNPEQRAFARAFIQNLQGRGSRANALERGVRDGLTDGEMDEIERQLLSRSSRLTNRTRGVNR